MSMSVGSSTYNPYAYLQFLLQQNQSSSGTTSQSFPVTGTGQQSTSVAAGSNTAALSGNSSLQFGPQTFGALLGLQTSDGGTSGFSPWSQFNADGSTSTSAGSQNPFAALASADSGATGQVTANANGSTTYAVTYADGAEVTFTTAASSAGSSSSGSGSSSGDANTVSNNFIEQLIQIQAQSLSAATTQSASDTTSGSQVQGQNGSPPPPFGSLVGLLAMADSGAPGQTTNNANGSTTYSITYADGSTVTMTTPESSDSSVSSDGASTSSSASSASSSNTASSNFIEQMIEMQAQLLNSLTTQSTSGSSSGQQTQQDPFGPPPPLGGIGSLLASADSGATSQTTSNANGSTTYTITYADGSTVTMTTPASSDTAASSNSASSSSNSNAASNNLFEQLIEMQAQLLSSATTQTVATA